MSIPTRLLLLGLLLASLFIIPAAADLPSSYDMRDVNLTPVITDQGIYGVCWAFASISSLESSMIRQDPETYTGIDLSPFSVVYYTYNRDELVDLASPYPGLEGIAGDTTHIDEIDPPDNISGLLLGGDLTQAMYTLAAGFGAVNESTTPFDSYGNNTAPSADTAISENEIVLDSVIIIPPTEIEDVKTMMLEKGAPAVGFFFNPAEPYLEELENGDWMYSLGDTNREDLESAGGHAVILIGWDDAFSKEQFYVTPKQDGAWLAQNSWGSNLSNITYFWMPYEELTYPITFFVGTEPWVGHTYQYDGGTLVLNESLTQTSASISNIFTCGGNEEIQAVSLDTNQSVNYTLRVYTDPLPDEPDSGTLLAEQEGVIAFPGYYTIRLDEPVPIEKGQTFSVVYDLEGREPLNISIDTSAVSEEVETVTFAKAGQSYLNDGTGWTDLSADGKTNLRIKAFTNDMVFWIGMDPISASMKERSVSVSGTTNFAAGKEIMVTLFYPDGEVKRETAVVKKGSLANFWEVTFSPVKMTEEEFFVSAERNGVLMESGFVPEGFTGMLVFGEKQTILPAMGVI
ncbi:Cysteine protease-like protein [Methanocorpusculum labreanum Z]|uniref:Cysteine protease-like protein n=1 Tax=Methanocorpusculum labreanum (strain ATCC 43576 / DSM 4855 / Z) TaxID=410358 RepID=A2SQ75_METLZ|nr:lectin like domain-containing protein [Methanocorpusculum labreanum]ABN06481.1 Cysteine protease-like protein [Methanocorpusculum labreanum Z]